LSGETITEEKAPSGDEVFPIKWIVGRCASLLSVFPEDKSPEEITDEIVSSLESDPRVVSVERPELDPKWTYRLNYHPRSTNLMPTHYSTDPTHFDP
jgi:hypothetical protein